MDLMAKIKNIIQWGRVTIASDDSGTMPISQVESSGKTMNNVIVYPYGMSGKAPVDSTVLRIQVGGSAQSPAGIEFNPDNRFKGLKEWEVKFGNFKTKAYLFFDEDGNIEMKLGKDGGNLKFENTDGSGTFELTEDGDIILNGGTEAIVKGDSFKTTWEAHSHSTAFGPSGAPLAPYNPLPASNLNDTVKV